MASTKMSMGNIWRPIFDDDDIPDLAAKTSSPQLNHSPNSSEPDCVSVDTCSDLDVSHDGCSNLDLDETIDPNIGEDSSTEYQDDVPKASVKGRSKKNPKFRGKSEASASPGAPSGPSSKTRMSGGVPPVRKKVCAEGDSDDEIIWNMKQKGYRDKPICDYLIANNRTRYDVKTISTRYSRIRRAKAAAEEKRLESDFEDYYKADDEALQTAVEESEARLQKDIKEAEERHWVAVAESMNAKLSAPKFTKRLAKERWEALQAGTASVPFEEDPNPEARKARISQEKAARREAREQEKLNAQHQAQRKKAAAADIARSKADTKVVLQQKRDKKQAALEAKKDRNQAKAEAAKETRRAKVAARADAQVNQHLQRERQKQERENQRAAKAWQKKLQSAELRQRKQEQKLHEAQRVADERAAAIREGIEDVKRRELIRRHMRLAGACIAAPLVDFPTAASAAAVDAGASGLPAKAGSKKRSAGFDSGNEFIPGATTTSRRPPNAKSTHSKTTPVKISRKPPAKRAKTNGTAAAIKRGKSTGGAKKNAAFTGDANDQDE